MESNLNDAIVSKSEEESKYEVSKKRWKILCLFCLLSASNASLWVTYAPISDISQVYFGGSHTISGSITSINMLATSYQVLFGPGTLLASQLMKNYDLRITVLVGGILTTAGALLRLIAALLKDFIGNSVNYSFALIGQSLAALAQPLYVNIVAALTSAWFPLSERDTATTISTLANPIGSAIGQIFPILFVTENSQNDVNGMINLLILELLVCGVPLLFAYLYFEPSPPTPPSRSTQLKLKVSNSSSSSANE